MAEVKQFKRRRFEGLDADKANVTGAAGDTYYATDTKRYYKWDGTRFRGGYEYIPRAIDTPDFAQATFPNLGAWQINGFDLSGIVPVGAVAVHLNVRIQSAVAADLLFQLRKSATSQINRASVITQVINLYTSEIHPIIMVDSDRLLDYFRTANINNIDVSVLGWFI